MLWHEAIASNWCTEKVHSGSLSTAVSLYYAPVMLVLGLVMGMLTSVTLRAMLPALGRLGYNIQENRKG